MKTAHYIRLAAVLAICGILIPQTLFSEEKRFANRAPLDTVLWSGSEKDARPITPKDTAIEGPGERLGLLGPIIAYGGKGKKAYIAVYDPAGVLVGAITKKEAKADPERLKTILRIAQKRAIIQNHHGLISILLKAQPQTAPDKGTQNQ